MADLERTGSGWPPTTRDPAAFASGVTNWIKGVCRQGTQEWLLFFSFLPLLSLLCMPYAPFSLFLSSLFPRQSYKPLASLLFVILLGKAWNSHQLSHLSLLSVRIIGMYTTFYLKCFNILLICCFVSGYRM